MISPGSETRASRPESKGRDLLASPMRVGCAYATRIGLEAITAEDSGECLCFQGVELALIDGAGVEEGLGAGDLVGRGDR